MTLRTGKILLTAQWTYTKFTERWVDEVLPILLEHCKGRFYVEPTWWKGYDDPRTSMIWFESPEDASAFAGQFLVAASNRVDIPLA